MKKSLIVLLMVFASMVSVMAQNDKFEMFAEKYKDKKGYEVVSVGRAAIRMAALAAGDKASRKMMNKIDMLVTVVHDGKDAGPLRGDFDRVVEGFESLGVFRSDTTEAALYLNPERTGFAMYSITTDGETVLLLRGEELSASELIPKDVKPN